MSRKRNDLLVTGFAMFAMFFGAGNLIFPPVLGVISGDQWFTAFLGFFLMDAGLAVLGVAAMIGYEGDMNRIGERLGKRVSGLLTVVMVLCLGPFAAIPRTGAVTYSMAVQPLLGLEGDRPLMLAVFSILFFAVVLLFSVRPGKVVGIIGRYMTPVLLICLLFLIIAGMLRGQGYPAEVLSDSPFREGVANGYQTMDGMAALLFSGMMIESALNDKNSTPARGRRKIGIASFMAGSLLFIVYGGLTYLGRVWGTEAADLYSEGTLDQAELLSYVVERILGRTGVYIIALISLFACLTTAIGLVSSCSSFFEKRFGGRISYRNLCIVISAASALLCNIGLSEIIRVAAPILDLVYPPIIVLMILGLFHRKITEKLPFALGAGTAFAVSLATVLCDTFGVQALDFIHFLPLYRYGVNFALPAAAAVVIGMGITAKKR